MAVGIVKGSEQVRGAGPDSRQLTGEAVIPGRNGHMGKTLCLVH